MYRKLIFGLKLKNLVKKVFLESHNVKNLASGFGIFNYELIKAFARINANDLEITLNLKNYSEFKNEFGDVFKYNLYSSLQRFDWWGVGGDYDVWHCANQNISVEPRKKPKKYILTVHDVNFAEEFEDEKDKVKRFKEKLKRVDQITYISNYAKEQTHKYFSVPDVEEAIIYNGNPVSKFLDTSYFKVSVPIEKPFFYSIGAFIPKKNFESLIRMMKEVPDYNLIISGNNQNSYGGKIRELIDELDLQDRVFLTGRVSELEKQFYMKNCEAFLFPSIGEGFGLPPIEAMKFGKPVMLSNLGSLPEIGGDAAFYWDDFDPIYMKELLFEKLNEVNNNRKEYEQKFKARANFFNWEESAKAYLDCYRN